MRRGHWNLDRVPGEAVITDLIKPKLYRATLPNGKQVTAFVDYRDEIEVAIGQRVSVTLSLADFDHARILSVLAAG
jgi:hypothetical protein